MNQRVMPFRTDVVSTNTLLILVNLYFEKTNKNIPKAWNTGAQIKYLRLKQTLSCNLYNLHESTLC